jgi:hypothetical protein
MPIDLCPFVNLFVYLFGKLLIIDGHENSSVESKAVCGSGFEAKASSLYLFLVVVDGFQPQSSW